MKFDAILLAAGLGSRLKPITDYLPKCLAPICGIPLLEIWINQLREGDVNKILVNTHYFSHMVEMFFDQKEYKSIEIFKESKLLGTAGSIKKMLNNVESENVIVCHSDNLSIFSLSEFLRSFKNRPKDCMGTMMLFNAETPSECGVVKLDSEKKVSSYFEKVKGNYGNLANGAVYIFDRSQLQDNVFNHDFDFSADVIPRIYPYLNTFKNNEIHIDIGNISNFLKAQELFLNYLKKSKNFEILKTK